MANEDLRKHLEFIQNAITRMANNSFLLKGWTITLVSAIFALAAKNAYLGLLILALFPMMAFWILDAYYLRQERLFRELYNSIRIRDAEKMQPIESFYMGTESFNIYVQSWIRTMFSKTIFIFYGFVFISILVRIPINLPTISIVTFIY